MDKTGSLSVRKISIVFFLFLSYILMRELFVLEPYLITLFTKYAFWGALFILFVVAPNSVFEYLKSRRTLMYLFAALGIIINSCTFGDKSEPVPGSIMIAAAFLLLLWHIGKNSSFFLKLSLLFIIYTAVSAVEYRSLAQTYAELTFIWLGVSFIMYSKETFNL